MALLIPVMFCSILLIYVAFYLLSIFDPQGDWTFMSHYQWLLPVSMVPGLIPFYAIVFYRGSIIDPMRSFRDQPMLPNDQGHCYTNDRQLTNITIDAACHLMEAIGTNAGRWMRLLAFPALLTITAGIILIFDKSPPFIFLPMCYPFAYNLIFVRPLARRIIAERLCFECGYCLRELPVDDNGNGQCPECGSDYHILQYEPPLH